MGLAAQILPSVGAAAQSGERKVGYCVIGLGTIADHFMRGVQGSSNSKITGLVSGHRDKAERIAAQYGVPKSSIYSYEDMDKFRDNKTIDAVYVALPNSMHAEYTIRSARRASMFCEKPMSDRERAEAMIMACRNAKVRCGTGCTTSRCICGGEADSGWALGKVQTINGAFGFDAIRRPGDLTVLAVAVLFDVGIYVVNACRYLTGEEPEAYRCDLND